MILHNIDHVYEKNNMHIRALQEKNDFLSWNLLVSYRTSVLKCQQKFVSHAT